MITNYSSLIQNDMTVLSIKTLKEIDEETIREKKSRIIE